MDQYRKVVDLNEVPSGRVRDVLRGLLEHLKLEIVCEETPDYTAYEVRPANGQLE